jgi:hypothetical protein
MPPNTTAQIQIAASTSGLPAALARGVSMVKAFAVNAKAALASLHLAPKANEKRNWMANATGVAAGNLATRGIDLLVDQGRAVFKFNDALVRFGIAARRTPAQLEAIAAAARATAAETGIDANMVLAAGRAYVDLAGAENFTTAKMNLLARAAQATGSDTKDLAGMMYQLTTSMRVTDAEMENTMGGLINQAKDGAIEAKEMASEFAAILPLFKRFGVVGREGTIQAGAMFQIMRDGANSASEAGTMLQRVYAGIQSYAPRFEKEGVQIYDKVRDKLGRKVLLPFDVIFKNIQGSEAMKDPARIKKMFGRTEGWRGMLLGDEASRAMDSADKKFGSVQSRLEQLMASGREDGVIMKDLGTYTESAAGRMAIAMEKMKNAIAEAFTPERIQKFVGAIEGLADKVGPLAEAIGKIGDGLGALYSIGKNIRGFISDDRGSAVFATTPDDVKRYAKLKGVSELEAYKQLETTYNKARELKVKIRDTIKDDKTTPESNKLAVRGMMQSPTEWGMLGEHEVGEQYVRNAGLTPDQVQKIKEQILKEQVDEAIASGKGQSTKAAPDIGAELLKAINAGAPAIGRAVSQSMRDPQVNLDGNKVSTGVGNATDRRRRP